ncbi:hypothetical protein T4D_1530 [Trichinella pseudospiralis]|uniref:Uncharacterized protein n=1 Tax=Trichinella pseudospiralis TaxID=6337 RepID=A0A0V1F687_TRIPS|nr:hypothetical protein T4D_1530 [Trichinella pseudospiralis]
MLAAVLQAMLTRATIRFLLRVSSQSRPGSTSQLGCPFLSSVSRTPVPPVVGSLRFDSDKWFPTTGCRPYPRQSNFAVAPTRDRVDRQTQRSLRVVH